MGVKVRKESWREHPARTCHRYQEPPAQARRYDGSPCPNGASMENRTEESFCSRDRSMTQTMCLRAGGGEPLCESALLNALRCCLRAAQLRLAYMTCATLTRPSGSCAATISGTCPKLGPSQHQHDIDVYGHWMPGNFKSEIDDQDRLHPSAPQLHPENADAKNS